MQSGPGSSMKRRSIVGGVNGRCPGLLAGERGERQGDCMETDVRPQLARKERLSGRCWKNKPHRVGNVTNEDGMSEEASAIQRGTERGLGCWKLEHLPLLFRSGGAKKQEEIAARQVTPKHNNLLWLTGKKWPPSQQEQERCRATAHHIHELLQTEKEQGEARCRCFWL